MEVSMSKTLQTTLIIITVLVGAAALVLAGITIGRSWWNPIDTWHQSMMGDFGGTPRGFNSGMMGFYGQSGTYGMMGVYGSRQLSDVEPLSLAEAEAAIENYLDALNKGDLVLGEIMIFDNHAYAEIFEQDTGIGAMEVLVDPVTNGVYPEPGPNMMWNLKYSAMADTGMMGGMMKEQSVQNLSSEMPISPEEAAQIAQRYLDRYAPGSEASEEVDPFYGYYTLHILQDGSTAGMLSVNGYSGEVFVHTWHGTLIEISEDH
jgi:hypothetical protein